MTKDDLVLILLERPGYIKSGAPKLSRVFNVTKSTARKAVREARSLIQNVGMGESNKDENVFEAFKEWYNNGQKGDFFGNKEEKSVEVEEVSEKKFKRLYFDIETSPNVMLSWRAGYKINLPPENIIKERAIICICWKWEGDKKVHHLTWDSNQCDKDMLKEFVKVLDEADEVIGHNGDRYDITWVRTRCLYHRIPCDAKIQSLDTLKKAKKYFNLNSNKLDYIGQFLGLGKKLDTGGFQLWVDILMNKSMPAMEKMVRYCKQDVELLEKVEKEIRRYVEHNHHAGSHQGAERHSCPNCGNNNPAYRKPLITKAGTVKHQMVCTDKDCKTTFAISNTVFKKYTEK